MLRPNFEAQTRIFELPRRTNPAFALKYLNRTVIVLSFVSLLADVASEMLYPVIPVYLKSIGFSMLLIGILEGVANFVSGLTKGYFGKQSDERGLRLPFVRLGYALSAVSKPMLALMAQPLWVFFSRTVDRLGKGLRTASRDALLAQNATPETKARVFGFHRSMDTLGAAIGPMIALALLYFFPGGYQLIFLIAFIPGALSVLLLFRLREERRPVSTLGRGNFFSFFRYWRAARPGYRRVVIGLLFFALFNSADLFLIVRTREITGSDTATIGAYILYNLVFALASWPLGSLADRIGIRTVFLSGIVLFAVVYLLFALAETRTMAYAAFVLYGIYAAATEGITKAWLSSLAGGRNTATALGFYTSCESICALLASFVAGAIWTGWGSTPTFLLTAAAAGMTVLYFLLAVRSRSGAEENSPS